jgi:intracellular septation protein
MSAGLRLGIDFGPLIVFFLANLLARRLMPWLPAGNEVFVATGAFMAATVAAMIASKVLGGAVSKMLLFSGVMVMAFGGLTLWLQDATFIKVKPTIYYLMVAAILIFGLIAKRPTLKLVMGPAFPGLDEQGWKLLSRNWAAFFVVMAIGNELAWRNLSFDMWIGYKIWGVFPATLLFGALNVPMLLRHGLSEEPAEAAVETPPQG